LTDPSTWKWTTADKRFLAFIKKSHEMGIRVIIDGVFNHVGTEHPAFQDVRRRGKQSKYADWFEVTRWEPFTYAGWAGHDSLPVFRKSEDGLASRGATKHIFDVTRRWMDPDGDGDPGDGIDGWRLDVPNEIAAPFWVEWRAVVKAANPDVYITGEIWDNAAAWLDGEHFDAVMNYQFAHAAVAWIFDKEVKTTASETDRRLAKLRMSYPPAATYVLQNLIASHDTDRVASMALNSDREYDRDNRNQDDNPAYNNDKPGPVEYARMRLITLLQMTYVGAPMIYYGDEVGMWGADDPTCRKPMLWKDLEPYAKPDENHVMEHHLAWFQKVIALRNGHPALRTGAFQTLLVDDAADVWAFARYDDDEQLIVALNASGEGAKVKIPLPADAPEKWRVEFSGGGPEIQYTGEGLEFSVVDDKLEIHVPALGGTVLESVR
jgi:glycosidase